MNRYSGKCLSLYAFCPTIVSFYANAVFQLWFIFLKRVGNNSEVFLGMLLPAFRKRYCFSNYSEYECIRASC